MLLGRLRELIEYRSVLYTFVAKDFQVKYAGSVFGVLWSQANPLLMLAVYTYVFSVVFQNDIPRFPVFLLAGIILWNFFSSSVSQSAFSIVSNGALIRKVYFPREIAPLSVVGLGLVDLLLSHVALALGYLYFGLRPSWPVLLLPIVIALLVLFCAGCSLILSTVTVFFRDAKYLVDLALLLGFFTTPVFYSISSIPEGIRDVVLLNPMAEFIAIYRSLMLDNIVPPLSNWLKLVLVDILFVGAGLWVFSRGERTFTDFV